MSGLARWVSIAVVGALLLVAAFGLGSAAASSVPQASAASAQKTAPASAVTYLGTTNSAPANCNPVQKPGEPCWSTGNLCQGGVTVSGSTWTCKSAGSSQGRGPGGQKGQTNLYWNFSSQNVTINVQIGLSDACITLNFHGFFNTINIDVTGGGYKCFNVAVNAESDVVNINYSSSGCSQSGGFTSNYYIYGKTTLVNFKTTDSQTTTNVYEISTEPGFAPCPSGLITAQTMTGTISISGSQNLLSTIWVNGPNFGSLDSALHLITLGGSLNWGHNGMNQLGFENTTIAPANGCSYLFPSTTSPCNTPAAPISAAVKGSA
jgi:hypothetical protein